VHTHKMLDIQAATIRQRVSHVILKMFNISTTIISSTECYL